MNATHPQAEISLPEAPRLDPQVMIDGYKLAKPKYARARLLACEIHADNKNLSPEQRAYWRTIANGLNKALVS